MTGTPPRGPVRLPAFAVGQRIGLFGGSFDPPHAAHRAVSLIALKRLKLDAVWWLVTPGNPLKDTSRLLPLAERIARARQLANHPRLIVTGVEAALGTRYTADTLAALARRAPGVRFVWIMGADNLITFHRWQHWRQIAQTVPLAIIDRPGASLKATAAPAARAFAARRLPEAAAPLLPRRRPPAWVLLHGIKSPLSSTRIRAATGP